MESMDSDDEESEPSVLHSAVPLPCGSLFSTNSLLNGTVKKCLRSHKFIAIKCFDINPKTSKPFSSCVRCMPLNRKQHNAFFATDNGRLKRQFQNAKPSIKKMKVDYRKSGHGKAKSKAYSSSIKVLDKCKQRSKTPAGKAARKRHYQKHKQSSLILKGIARIIKGLPSDTTMLKIEFESPDDVRNHFQGKFSNDMNMINHGTIWHVDHIIPRSAYNHDDPEDTRRCWSKPNMRPIDPKLNREKSCIIQSECLQVPKTHWPKAWMGAIPKSSR